MAEIKKATTSRDEQVSTLRMQIAEKGHELDINKKARADAEKLVREIAREIEDLKDQLIKALSQ